MLEGCTGQVQRPGTKAVYLKEFVFVCFFFFFFLLVGNFHIGNQAASYIYIYYPDCCAKLSDGNQF